MLPAFMSRFKKPKKNIYTRENRRPKDGGAFVLFQLSISRSIRIILGPKRDPFHFYSPTAPSA
ncbi:MAG: hypothetical protein LIP11_04595, partial [Clostridiales bacterium]|nr:hypothetical protein [Clostridiales bacterium]